MTDEIRSCVDDLESKILRKLTGKSETKMQTVQNTEAGMTSETLSITGKYDDKTFDAALNYLKQEVEMLMQKRKMNSENEYGPGN